MLLNPTSEGAPSIGPVPVTEGGQRKLIQKSLRLSTRFSQHSVTEAWTVLSRDFRQRCHTRTGPSVGTPGHLPSNSALK